MIRPLSIKTTSNILDLYLYKFISLKRHSLSPRRPELFRKMGGFTVEVPIIVLMKQYKRHIVVKRSRIIYTNYDFIYNTFNIYHTIKLDGQKSKDSCTHYVKSLGLNMFSQI